jgi:3-oxoacyl-[acyl-carrier-protein] synthase II
VSGPVPDDRRVLVTGVGLHSGLGDSGAALRALRAGRSAVAPCSVPGAEGLGPLVGAPSDDGAADLARLLPDRKLAKYMSPVSRMAVLAAGRALERAGLLGDRERLASTGLYVSTGLIAFDLASVRPGLEASLASGGGLDLARMGGEGLRRCHPLFPFRLLLNMPLGLVSIAYGVRGPNHLLYPDGGQGAAVLLGAARAVRRGRVERALVGGADQALSLLPLATLSRLGRLARSVEEAVPFAPGHRGLAPADAAAFLVLESERAAAERGVPALAVLEGAASTFEGTAPGSRVPWPAAAPDPDRDPLEDLLERASPPGRPPDRILATSTLDSRTDERLSDAVRRFASPALESFDGRIGHAPAAALPLATALVAERISGRGAGRELCVLVDPDGARAAVVLAATEPRRSA